MTRETHGSEWGSAWVAPGFRSLRAIHCERGLIPVELLKQKPPAAFEVDEERRLATSNVRDYPMHRVDRLATADPALTDTARQIGVDVVPLPDSTGRV